MKDYNNEISELPFLLSEVTIPEYFNPSTFKNLIDCPLSVINGLSEKELLPVHPKAILGNIVHEVIHRVGALKFENNKEAVDTVTKVFTEISGEKEKQLARKPETKRLVPLRQTVGLTAWRNRTADLRAWARMNFDSTKDKSETPTMYEKRKSTVRNYSAVLTPGELSMGREIPLTVPKLRLSGRPDLLKRDNRGTIHITDFKTGNIFDKEGNIQEHLVYQLCLYAIMIENIDHNADLKLWIEGSRRIEIPWDFTIRTETVEKLTNISTLLPPGKHVFSDSIVKTGLQCFRCRIRHRCQSYRQVAPEWWTKTSTRKKVAPFDIWGNILQLKKENGNTSEIEIENAAGQMVKVSGLNLQARDIEITSGKKIYFFGLEPSENFRLHGVFRHPVNFHDRSPSYTWKDAVQLKIFIEP